ncbi:hypothetical protein [Nocardia sp. CA-119907]|uniref:hypothetical protein n=1 Tax=Nocardia sp. CA-119907 TaxID=3239973 RepID=UPI003D994D1A
MLGGYRYVQSHMIAAPATPAGIQANQLLTEDEKNFIDLPRSSFFLTKEHVLLG